jgi:hypothetical protein
MNTIFKIFLALLATAITPAILAGIISQSKDFGIIVFAIAFIHFLILGIPAFIWGWASNSINLYSTLVTAFIIGTGPSTLLLLAWPRYSAYSSVDFLQELRFVTILGLSGLFGGVVFWLIWRFWIQTDLQDEK